MMSLRERAFAFVGCYWNGCETATSSGNTDYLEKRLVGFFPVVRQNCHFQGQEQCPRRGSWHRKREGNSLGRKHPGKLILVTLGEGRQRECTSVEYTAVSVTPVASPLSLLHLGVYHGLKPLHPTRHLPENLILAFTWSEQRTEFS